VPYVQPLTHLGRSSITRGHPFSPTNSRRTAHFRQKVRSAYQRHVMGAQGLMTHIESGVWWRLRDSWNNSKSAGCRWYCWPTGACRASRGGGLPGRRAAVPEHAGIQPPHRHHAGRSRSSGGRHSLQSWTGCTVAATVSEVSPGGFIQPAWWWLAIQESTDRLQCLSRRRDWRWLGEAR